jgi:hypothetical protein
MDDSIAVDQNTQAQLIFSTTLKVNAPPPNGSLAALLADAAPTQKKCLGCGDVGVGGASSSPSSWSGTLRMSGLGLVEVGGGACACWGAGDELWRSNAETVW